ncbi:hypothetical protein PROFUN_01535 [Planoprotostelium fungivorum]|uniref:Uncharacterized protein n=1 Tax=Planoprotostelium fungivorum TaxID=1890364 RepID=A0A2P6NTH6_9EUKA|nr:hypothetical protein PROFUN_01535 [Planoprotostelium fungivorum]
MGTPLYVFTRGVCVSGKKKDAFYPTWNDSKVLGSKLSKAIFLSKGCTFTLFSITSVHSDQGFCKVDLKCCAQHLTSLTNWKARRKVSENSATKKHIQCTFIEKEHLGFLWFEIILYKQRLIELFGSYVFQAILGQNNGMMQQAYNKYLAANAKVNDLTRQQQSKQKQFLGCVAKHTPPEVFQKCVEQYDDPDAKYEQYKIIPYSGLRNSAYEKELNAGHTNRAAVLRPPPGMKIQHLPKGIREYVSKNPSEFKDYLDEISAETKYLSTISRLVKKETGPDARDRIRRRILQAAEDTDCLKHRIQNTKIRGKKCELSEESENLKGLFERELTTYNNKKQCMKMNNKRYEERLQELLEEKEKEYEVEIKRVQVECTSKTMSLELQLEESLKEYMAHYIACFTQVQQAGKRHKEKHKAHNNAC